jgi:bacteriocin biosynthesis cyclodehydratase domain-containing protein
MLLEHGGTVVTLEGRGVRALMPKLLPLLDGTRTVEEIGEVLGMSVMPAVEKALRLLVEHRLLVEGGEERPTDGPAVAAGAFAAANTRLIAADRAVAALTAARVAVVGSGPAAREIVRQLRRTGIGDVASLSFERVGSNGSLAVVVPEPSAVGRLTAFNRERLEHGDPWLQVLPYDGRTLVVGPLFLPGSSGCRECYTLRRGACCGFEDDYELVESTPTRATAPLSLTAVAAGLTSLLVIRWLTIGDPYLPGAFYALETGAVLELSHHRLLRVPRCPSCGPLDSSVPSPWFGETA